MGGRGPKKHLKRVNAPKHWMLSKLDGVHAPKTSAGPHKMRESVPLIILLRNRLKYALTGAEANAICMQELVKVDGRVRLICISLLVLWMLFLSRKVVIIFDCCMIPKDVLH